MDPTTWATSCGGWASNLAPPAILTLLQLGAELPRIVLADLLGIHISTAERWNAAAGARWSSYAARSATTATEAS